METQCGLCSKIAYNYKEKLLIFGKLKSHQPVICKSCRKVKRKVKRETLERQFDDRDEDMIYVPPHKAKSVHNLMKVHNERELQKDRMELKNIEL